MPKEKNVSVKVSVRANKTVPFTLANIDCMLSILQGVAVPSLTPDSVREIEGKLKALREFVTKHVAGRTL